MIQDQPQRTSRLQAAFEATLGDIEAEAAARLDRLEDERDELKRRLQHTLCTKHAVLREFRVVDELARSDSEDVAGTSTAGDPCTVCLDNEPAVLWLPCGHVSLCERCAYDLLSQNIIPASCPTCREPFDVAKSMQLRKFAERVCPSDLVGESGHPFFYPDSRRRRRVFIFPQFFDWAAFSYRRQWWLLRTFFRSWQTGTQTAGDNSLGIPYISQELQRSVLSSVWERNGRRSAALRARRRTDNSTIPSAFSPIVLSDRGKKESFLDRVSNLLTDKIRSAERARRANLSLLAEDHPFGSSAAVEKCLVEGFRKLAVGPVVGIKVLSVTMYPASKQNNHEELKIMIK